MYIYTIKETTITRLQLREIMMPLRHRLLVSRLESSIENGTKIS
jgi:hypothetical protein